MDTENNALAALSAPVLYSAPAPAADPFTIIPAAPADTVAELIEQVFIPIYPIGIVDFNKPFIVIDEHDEDRVLDDAVVIAILKGSLHPIVVSFWEDGEQIVAQFDKDGEHVDNDLKIENISIGVQTFFVAVMREGRKLVVDEDLFMSEADARSCRSFPDTVAVLPISFDPHLKPVKPAPAPAVSTTAEVVSVDDKAARSEDGIEEEEDSEDIDGTEVDHTDKVEEAAPEQVYVNGHQRMVGALVRANRRGFGNRLCKIVKLRNDTHKALYIDPQDGNEPYWARNKSIQYGPAYS